MFADGGGDASAAEDSGMDLLVLVNGQIIRDSLKPLPLALGGRKVAPNFSGAGPPEPLKSQWGGRSAATWCRITVNHMFKDTAGHTRSAIRPRFMFETPARSAESVLALAVKSVSCERILLHAECLFFGHL